MTEPTAVSHSNPPKENPSQSRLELPGSDREDRPWELRAQRIGWGAFALLVLAALVGLLGHGPLSHVVVQDPASPLRVEYNRFERYQGPTDLRLRLGPGAAREGGLRIWISRAFLDAIELEQVVPQPRAVELGADRQTYVFDAPGLSGEASVVFHHKPDVKFSRVTAQVGLDGAAGVTFWQFVYP
jgi:hypothetical protein